MNARSQVMPVTVIAIITGIAFSCRAERQNTNFTNTLVPGERKVEGKGPRSWMHDVDGCEST